MTRFGCTIWMVCQHPIKVLIELKQKHHSCLHATIHSRLSLGTFKRKKKKSVETRHKDSINET